MVRDTSLKTYREIQEENYDSRMDEVLQIIIKCPLMTGREYANLLGYADMNIVRPRITDLKTKGHIIEVGKRKCSLGGRTSYVWTTKSNIEKHILKKLDFKETIKDLYSYEENETILYQDFRTGKRKSYTNHTKISYKLMPIYIQFKQQLNSYINKY